MICDRHSASVLFNYSRKKGGGGHDLHVSVGISPGVEFYRTIPRDWIFPRGILNLIKQAPRFTKSHGYVWSVVSYMWTCRIILKFSEKSFYQTVNRYSGTEGEVSGWQNIPVEEQHRGKRYTLVLCPAREKIVVHDWGLYLNFVLPIWSFVTMVLCL